MANKFRGEVEIEVGSEKFTLRPTYTAVVEIEARLDRTLGDLVVSTRTRGLTLFEMTTIVWAGASAANPKLDLTLEQMGDKIFASGIIKTLTHGDSKNTLARFLIGALGIDPDVPPVAKPEGESGNVPTQTTDATG